MNMHAIILASTAILALSASAFAVDKETYQSNTQIEKYSDGDYTEKDTVVKTEVDGTTNSSENNLRIAVDANGNIDKSRTTETVHAPKDPGSKHITLTVDTETTKDGQVTTTHQRTIDGKNVEGTTDHYTTSSKIQQDSKGNYAEKDITTKIDPDGTLVSFERNADVTVAANGDVNKTITTKKVTDPPGLGKKTTVNTSNTEKTENGMVESSQAVIVNGKTVERKSAIAPQQQTTNALQ